VINSHRFKISEDLKRVVMLRNIAGNTKKELELVTDKFVISKKNSKYSELLDE
jgi:hypothetical protein